MKRAATKEIAIAVWSDTTSTQSVVFTTRTLTVIHERVHEQTDVLVSSHATKDGRVVLSAICCLCGSVPITSVT